MRLKALSLKRFKAFREADLELGPLTVFIGRNNAGKSSLLQAITLLAQSNLNQQLNTRSPIDLGQTPSVLVHREPGTTASAGWEIGLRWEGAVSDVAPGLPSYGPLSLRLDTMLKPEAFLDVGANVEITDEVGRTWTMNAPNQPGSENMDIQAAEYSGESRNLPRVSVTVPFTRRSLFSFDPSVTPPPAHATDTADSSPGAVTNYVLRVTSPLLRDVAPKFFERFRYVGPNRHVDQSIYQLGTQLPFTIQGPWDLVTMLAYRRDILNNISERCREVFGYEIELLLVPPQQVSLTAIGPNHSLNVISMGTGLIQMLWMLTILELAASERVWTTPSATENSLHLVPAVGLEEPELHLHPAAQPDVAKILAHFATSGLQVVCTTQSEHLLMALLTLVLSRELPPESLYVYYVQDGSAERLRVDERGQIEGGLRGFFESNEDELKRYIDLLRSNG